MPKIFTLAKFIKNGDKYFKGVTELDKVNAWTLKMPQTFRAMEVQESHCVGLASCMFGEDASFWWQ